MLRFYPGGPQAIRGNAFWLTRNGTWGCDVTRDVGVTIPSNTYGHADPELSQVVWTPLWDNGRPVGLNCTALLPVEV